MPDLLIGNYSGGLNFYASNLDHAAYVGINKYKSNSEKWEVMVYPNPAKDEATLAVSLNKKLNVVYSIYDQAGKKLISNTALLYEGINTISLPVKNLPAGIYFIQLAGDALFKQSQFVKQ